jgi:hypothetical protein
MKIIFSLALIGFFVIVWWMYVETKKVDLRTFKEDDELNYQITEKDAKMPIKQVDIDNLDTYNLIKKENE